MRINAAITTSFFFGRGQENPLNFDNLIRRSPLKYDHYGILAAVTERRRSAGRRRLTKLEMSKFRGEHQTKLSKLSSNHQKKNLSTIAELSFSMAFQSMCKGFLAIVYFEHKIVGGTHSLSRVTLLDQIFDNFLQKNSGSKRQSAANTYMGVLSAEPSFDAMQQSTIQLQIQKF